MNNRINLGEGKLAYWLKNTRNSPRMQHEM